METTALAYLRSQVPAWGIGLMQASPRSGFKSEHYKAHMSPRQLTENWQGRLVIGDMESPDANKCVNVGCLGVFEWLALTLQENDDNTIDKHSESWLIANRIIVDSENTTYVPVGGSSVGRPYITVALDSETESRAKLRLAIL
jgi:hypothetical protein